MQMHYGWNELKKIDFMPLLPVILPVFAIGMILILIALMDLYKHRKTRKNVWLWSLIIIFLNMFGPIMYFVIGRKDRERI
ncbi:PLDc_N domain-containing protein [Paenibacillus sp. SYP-B3998]|uniref:PLDc_N domain-containing protein n=1 Tax=Paenibacillus sp. SYP-B3998 TaxID=2678564 RepID=A0A6G3ZV14_9BACL|nr:PLD nuclease N-terminal domain-containing protein [Paenibacillus sp. SYP-B3998]NEW05955.1 PLDc_N domain-containing protein [Paenibacillus sp. SYP-B3998]